MSALQEVWHPKKIKPPDGVGHELADHEGPGLTVRDQMRPFDFRHRLLRVAADVCEFGFRQARMFLWLAIEQQPKQEPDKSQRACDHECPAPSPLNRNPG